MVAAVLSGLLVAVAGRGYVARHRLADAALGLAPVATPASRPAQLAGTSRQSVAPRLSVVRAPKPTDLAVDAVLSATLLADTLPHPVVTLLPLPTSTSASADEQVYAAIDAERDEQAVIDLTAGADVRAYSARHIA